MAIVPPVTFNNGKVYPVLGLSTWKTETDVTAAIEYAIDLGYRHFDCAYVYQNEKEVGEAIFKKISQGVVTRKELFITSKLWNTFHRPGIVEHALNLSLQNLHLTYLDLYLMHWPFSFKEGSDFIPYDSNCQIVDNYVDYVDTWKAMEDLQRKGLVKSIGVCNFNRRQIDRLLRFATISPVTNQIELHPYLNQIKFTKYCRSQGILPAAYYPLGSQDRPWASPDEPQLLDDANLRRIASKYNKTPAQVVLKYQTQRGNIAIVRSATLSKIEEYINIFDFQLSPDDMRDIESFECNGRICRFESAVGLQYYPFNDES